MIHQMKINIRKSTGLNDNGGNGVEEQEKFVLVA